MRCPSSSNLVPFNCPEALTPTHPSTYTQRYRHRQTDRQRERETEGHR